VDRFDLKLELQREHNLSNRTLLNRPENFYFRNNKSRKVRSFQAVIRFGFDVFDKKKNECNGARYLPADNHVMPLYALINFSNANGNYRKISVTKSVHAHTLIAAIKTFLNLSKVQLLSNGKITFRMVKVMCFISVKVLPDKCFK
jgi:hypothetical protein